MSRIHEALKRAEQERVTGQPAQNSDPQAEHTVATRVVETAPPPPPSKLPQAVLPHLSTTRIEAQPGSGPVQFDALWAKCKRTTWKPDLNTIVFENSDPFFPGAEQFRTLRSRLYRMRETQPLQTILVSSAIPAEGKTVISTN